MNYNNFSQETSRMVELMKYGMNESASKSSAPAVEYSVKAADGLTYGIVNEGTKFYIKVAPKKHTKILNEDFDYIGGEVNKKYNEYKSYSAAAKDLDLKIMQINEKCNNSKKVIVEASKPSTQSDWQINETVEMRNAINRMNQISRNVNYILTEGSIPSEHTLPEAPAKNPSQDKVNSPFTDTATAKGDKDFTEKETNYEKPSGTPYSNNTNAKMTSDKKPSMSGNNGNAYTDTCKYCPSNSVANEHPKGGKVTRADESKRKRTIKLTEEQVLAWDNAHPNYMDKSQYTKIGSSAPYEKEGTSAEAENGVIAESDFDDEDIAGFDGYDEEEELPFPEVENDGDEYELEFDDDVPYEDEEDLYEGKLNDFGKHPAYKMQPMTLPPNKEVAPNGARDWNDESAEGEEEYGKKIGSSAPFEKAVQRITNSVMESLGF